MGEILCDECGERVTWLDDVHAVCYCGVAYYLRTIPPGEIYIEKKHGRKNHELEFGLV